MRISRIDPARLRRAPLRVIVLPALAANALAVGVGVHLGPLLEDVSPWVTVVCVCTAVVLSVVGFRTWAEFTRRIEEDEAQHRAIFDGSREALLIVDDSDCVLEANPAAERLFGASVDGLTGITLATLTDAPAGARTSEARAHRSGGTHCNVEVSTLCGVPGERRILSFRDLSERQRAEEEVRRLTANFERRVKERTAQLEEAIRELESFSYSVSHDLRSPLRHISGFSALLRRSAGASLPEQTRHYVTTIADSAQRATTLVDELLSFSRMGRAELRNSEVDLDDLVEEVREELAHEADGREITWTVGRLPVVRGDGAMLRLVVRNLLSNALKYTRPREEARIAIDCTRDGDTWIFRVKDNGVGFDMAYADRLFGVFKRLHRDEEFEGTGIGLANVRRIVTRHGGRTWAEAKVGEGATFCFSLPIDPPGRPIEKEGAA